MKFKVERALYDEARKAKSWYETTGMKVAKTPAIPHIVASWILLKCEPPAEALCGKYLGDNDATTPQLTCLRWRDHEGLCDNARGDDP